MIRRNIAKIMNRAFLTKILLCLPLLLVMVTAQANSDNTNKLNIALAANFLPAFKEIRVLFETQTGIRLIASSGSTGQLYHQIRFGAPHDIFFSADQHTSQRLIKEGLAVPASYFIYAQGRLVLWSTDTLLPLDKGELFNTYDKNKRIALANPKIAPYGKAAKELMENINADKQWQNNLIMGQNISQTYQFIASGNVDLGFISLAQLRHTQIQKKMQNKIQKQKQNQSQSNDNYWLVPKSLHQPIKQTAVLLENSHNKLQAKQFLDFLKTPDALTIMQRFGYEH